MPKKSKKSKKSKNSKGKGKKEFGLGKQKKKSNSSNSSIKKDDRICGGIISEYNNQERERNREKQEERREVEQGHQGHQGHRRYIPQQQQQQFLRFSLKAGENIQVGKNTFQLEKILGEGISGQVWKAKNKNNNKEIIALKLIEDDSQIKRFEELGWDSPYVVGMSHEAAEIKNNRYGLPLEFMGPSLKNILSKFKQRVDDPERPVPDAFLDAIGYYMLCALQYMASKNLIHDDIKPDNILLDSNIKNRICLADFGETVKALDSNSINDKEYLLKYILKTVPGGDMNWTSVSERRREIPTFWDDLESLLYVLIYMKTAEIPFKNLRIAYNEEEEQIWEEFDEYYTREYPNQYFPSQKWYNTFRRFRDSHYYDIERNNDEETLAFKLNKNEQYLPEYQELKEEIFKEKPQLVTNLRAFENYINEIFHHVLYGPEVKNTLQKRNYLEKKLMEDIEEECASLSQDSKTGIYGKMLFYVVKNNNQNTGWERLKDWAINKTEAQRQKLPIPLIPERLLCMPDYDYLKSLIVQADHLVDQSFNQLKPYKRRNKIWGESFFRYEIFTLSDYYQ